MQPHNGNTLGHTLGNTYVHKYGIEYVIKSVRIVDRNGGFTGESFTVMAWGVYLFLVTSFAGEIL
jgi:hypothetical protein